TVWSTMGQQGGADRQDIRPRFLSTLSPAEAEDADQKLFRCINVGFMLLFALVGATYAAQAQRAPVAAQRSAQSSSGSSCGLVGSGTKWDGMGWASWARSRAACRSG